MIARYRFDRYTDETITTSLLYLRAQIVRDGSPGIENVDALLRLRGVDPEGQRVPQKVVRKFRNGDLRRAVLATLRDGPKTSSQIYDRICPMVPHASRRAVSKRVWTCLKALRERGVVKQEGRVWMCDNALSRHKIA